MREILFRGKRKDNGEWVYGDLIHRKIWSSELYIIRVEDNGFDSYTEYEVIPETVGQYTGLDINGTKIFDGDIIDVFAYGRKMFLFWNEETFSWEIADVGTQLNEVNHLINCMSLGEIGVEACFENEVRSKVIGNIYDNPEMMEANDIERSNQTF